MMSKGKRLATVLCIVLLGFSMSACTSSQSITKKLDKKAQQFWDYTKEYKELIKGYSSGTIDKSAFPGKAGSIEGTMKAIIGETKDLTKQLPEGSEKKKWEEIIDAMELYLGGVKMYDSGLIRKDNNLLKTGKEQMEEAAANWKKLSQK